jgi:hypothetical protein
MYGVMDSSKIIVSEAFKRVEEYYGNVKAFVRDYSYYFKAPHSLTTRGGGDWSDKRRYNDKPIEDFTFVLYKNKKITSEMSTLEGFNIIEMREILTVLLMKIPLEFVASDSSSYGVHS